MYAIGRISNAKVPNAVQKKKGHEGTDKEIYCSSIAYVFYQNERGAYSARQPIAFDHSKKLMAVEHHEV